MTYFPKKHVCAYFILFVFLGDVAFSIAAPYKYSVSPEKQLQFILYSPVLGESLSAVAERFAIPVSTLAELRDRFSTYGWSDALVLVPYREEGEARLYNNYVPYQLKSRETLAAVAGKFNRSARELSVLNGQVMSINKLNSLKAGDFILVPGPVSSGEANTPAGQDLSDQGKLASATPHEATGIANFLGATKLSDATGMLIQSAIGSLSGGVSRNIENFSVPTVPRRLVYRQASVKDRSDTLLITYIPSMLAT